MLQSPRIAYVHKGHGQCASPMCAEPSCSSFPMVLSVGIVCQTAHSLCLAATNTIYSSRNQLEKSQKEGVEAKPSFANPLELFGAEART